VIFRTGRDWGLAESGETIRPVDGHSIHLYWCWWYRKYAPENGVLEGLETEAREGRKGLWADPEPVLLLT